MILSIFFFQAEDGIRDYKVTGVQTCALPILNVGDRDVNRGVRLSHRRSRHVGLVARAQQVGTREVGKRPACHLPEGLPLQDHSPSAVPELDGLIDWKLNVGAALQKVGGSEVVAPGRYLDSRTECDVSPGVRRWVQQPYSAD